MSIKSNEIENVKVKVSYHDYLNVAKYSRYIVGDIVLRVLLGMVETASFVLQAVMLSMGVGSVFNGTDFGTATMYFLVAAACIIFRSFLVRYKEGYIKQMAGKIKAILREMVIDKLMKLGPGYQMDKRSGRFQSLVTDGVEYIEPYLVNYIPQVFIVLFSVTPLVIYIFTKSVAAGAIVTGATLLAILMPHILMPFYTTSCIGYWKSYAVLNSQYIDTMQGMNTLKLFNAEEYMGDELRKSSEKFRMRQLTNTRNSLFSTANIALMTGIATSITTGVVAYQVADGNIPRSVLLTVMFLVIECVRPIGDLNTAWHGSMMGFSVASEILELLDAPITTTEKEDALTSGIDEGLPEIELRGVTFKYSSKREQAINDLSMKIEPGQTVAVVGESGAGKSTLVNLLLRFYDTGEGQILINGRDVRDYSLDYLRSKIAVVFQTTYLFYGSIKDNLRIAREDASDEEIIDAAKKAKAHDFIEALPNGYDTIVGERGETLSGGQRQRIAIARAILKGAPVLVLDEATSSIDASSEQSIKETMDKLQGQFTTIIIAHRLSTIQNAQKIFVFDKGHIVEEGTHRDLLLDDKGVYKRLIEAQSFEGDKTYEQAFGY